MLLSKVQELSFVVAITKLFDIKVKGKYPAATCINGGITVSAYLTDGDENALRYVAGYTIRLLIRKNQIQIIIIIILNILNIYLLF